METLALILASISVISMFIYMVKEFDGHTKKKANQ